MSRLPSDATKLRSALRYLKEVKGALALCKIKRDEAEAMAALLKKDRDEWKARFDKLLERMPEDQK